MEPNKPREGTRFNVNLLHRSLMLPWSLHFAKLLTLNWNDMRCWVDSVYLILFYFFQIFFYACILVALRFNLSSARMHNEYNMEWIKQRYENVVHFFSLSSSFSRKCVIICGRTISMSSFRLFFSLFFFILWRYLFVHKRNVDELLSGVYVVIVCNADVYIVDFELHTLVKEPKKMAK